ncbi:diadenylate cyclase CdaA [Selenomonadales bacterium OttesenSCG-928-I06]|nr:diadenylate cyclase CdaA [Selenomonadales bacterium OttesenSCG-928-I06]
MVVQLQGIISTITILDVLDIVIVGLFFYNFYFMLKNTQAMTLVKGLLLLMIVMLGSKWLDLNVVNWLLEKFMTVVLVALPVVFQPELRRGLDHLGRGKFLQKGFSLNLAETNILFTEIVNTVAMLARNKIGALIVIERETGLNEYIDTGIKVDGLISREFLTNIFIPNTPLHDGAVIIRGNRLQAAGCLLPLTQERNLSKELGTRHRAAIGLTEETDAVVIVVSEETGIVSIAVNGRLTRYLTKDDLLENLSLLFKQKPSSMSEFFSRRSSK